MGGRMTPSVYKKIIEQDIAWLDKQPRTLEHDHIRAVLLREIEVERPRLTDIVLANLAAVLLNRYTPLAPHHAGALRELLGYPTDDDLSVIVLNGWQKWKREKGGAE